MKPRQTKRPRRQRGNGDNRTGASAVEFAVVANICFLMIFTCIEFARMNVVRNLAQDAAYFAARHVIVPGATASEAEAEADRIMGAMLNNGYTVTVGDVDENARFVSVTVAVDLHDVAMFAPFFLPDAVIQTTARMRTERYEGFYEQ